MKTILVAVDGSEQTGAALDAAVELAREEGARLVCVHVISALDMAPHENGKHAAPPSRPPRADEDPVLRDAIAQTTGRALDVVAELLVGYPPNQILRLAEELDADLIVVGSRGLGRVKSVIVGSTSRELVTRSRRPVLVVRDVGVPERV